ncbi:uncharacterized protein LOC120177579 [Hibiscus syriacus]|uniref:uncharacterized protein LOC120177579 n=1 Tax=Hibiscus syriacus TaxID=106335 RepID=UPI0019232343|nr:uncharacterized protein LOC120177579 [Hibiscus syriacus]
MDNIVRNDAWLIGGDFNVIFNMEETSNAVNSGIIPDISDFQRCVEELRILDHQFMGPLFTWSNKQQDTYLACKLDRVLINSSWIEAFPSSVVEFQAPGDLDHCPSLVWLHKGVPIAKPKPFKFFNFWVLYHSFMSIVEESWQSSVGGNLAQVLFLKLKRLKSYLKELNMTHFHDISGQVQKKRDDLLCIQLFNLNDTAAGSFIKDELEVE